jgi:hypothetical protein
MRDGGMSGASASQARPFVGTLLERVLPVLAGAVALLLVWLISRQVHGGALTHRAAIAGVMATASAIIAVLAFVVPRMPLATRLVGPAQRDMLASTATVATFGLAAIAFLALYPPPLEASHFKAWDYLDKRWMIALYLLANGLVFIPGLSQRLLFGDSALVRVAPAVRAKPLGIALKITAGCLLALLYLAPMLPETLVRFLDAHELVHLGGFQRITQGAAPYIDARTQYGPGHQILTYEMMRHLGVTLYGFRLSQAWLNLVGIAVMLSLWLVAFGWRIGGATILAALIISPLLVATFWGWALILRWVGPPLVGALLPLLIWRDVSARTRLVAVALMGMACGALAWLAQENLTGVIETVGLVLLAAIVRRALPLQTAIMLGLVFVVVQVTTLLILLALSLGLGELREGLRLYFLSTGLVFQGMTNNAWTESGPWRWAYRLTPLVIIAIAAAALYLRKPGKDTQDDLRIGQLLGMVAAVVPLTMLSLFRADTAHFIATSAVLAPLLVLAITWLPGRLEWGFSRANAVRVAMALLCLVIYTGKPWNNLHERASNLRTFANPKRLASPHALAQGLAMLAGGGAPPHASAADPFGKLGFQPDPASRCCYLPKWTWAELNGTYSEIHRLTANRPTFVDVLLPRESSGIYFLADLNVGSPYVSRIMSVWTDGDIRELEQSFDRKTPACVVSDNPQSALTRSIVAHYRTVSSTRLAGPLGLWLFCSGESAPDVAR